MGLNALAFTVIPFVATYVILLVIDLHKAERARVLRQSGLCPLCGYELRGEHERGCPECGWNRK